MSELHNSARRSIPVKLNPMMAELVEAYEYATDLQVDVWDFAVSIHRLLELGANSNDFRWLTRKGYVKHAKEVTRIEDERREFRPTGDLTFSRRTCFVLTDLGMTVARMLRTNPSELVIPASASDGIDQTADATIQAALVPDWDPDLRKLRVDGQIVKRFKWPALNQEAVLCAFQEEGWPEKIDDPLPPQLEQDPKRRLADTIKCLNKNQKNRLIRFHGDGTGEGVVWELIGPHRQVVPAK